MREDAAAPAPEPRAVKPISGGSLREADLPAVVGVAAAPPAEASESPFAQGLRRLQRSVTALVGVAIVAVLLVVAIFADALAPHSPTINNQMMTFARPSW